MKFITLIILFMISFSNMRSLRRKTSSRAHRMKTLEEKLQPIQELLNTGNPNCVEYRDAVNEYIKEFLVDKSIAKKCQLQCHNLDSSLADETDGWYIRNSLPIEKTDCGKVVDDCNYEFGSKYFLGSGFFQELGNAQDFIDFVLRRSYLHFCSKDNIE